MVYNATVILWSVVGTSLNFYPRCSGFNYCRFTSARMLKCSVLLNKALSDYQNKTLSTGQSIMSTEITSLMARKVKLVSHLTECQYTSHNHWGCTEKLERTCPLASSQAPPQKNGESLQCVHHHILCVVLWGMSKSIVLCSVPTSTVLSQVTLVVLGLSRDSLTPQHPCGRVSQYAGVLSWDFLPMWQSIPVRHSNTGGPGIILTTFPPAPLWQSVTPAYQDTLPQGCWEWRESQDNPGTAGVTPAYRDTLPQGWRGVRESQDNPETAGVTPTYWDTSAGIGNVVIYKYCACFASPYTSPYTTSMFLPSG